MIDEIKETKCDRCNKVMRYFSKKNKPKYCMECRCEFVDISHSVGRDYEILSSYLNLSSKISIGISPIDDKSVFINKTIFIGIKNKYDRRELINCCIDASGKDYDIDTLEKELFEYE